MKVLDLGILGRIKMVMGGVRFIVKEKYFILVFLWVEIGKKKVVDVIV